MDMAALAPFLCTFCGAYLHSFDRLQRHRYRHKMKYIRIRTKQASFSTANSLTGQQRYTSNHDQVNVLRQFRSGLMEAMYHKTYSTHDYKLSRVINYSRKHTEKKYQCEHCQKRFTRNDHLKNHVRTHTKERPYQCEHCQKCFTRNDHLKSHIRTHTKEKSYQCEHCQKCFSESGNLKRHIRTHTKERPYQCEYCQKCFTRNDHLKTHIRSHTKEKPFRCEHCQKRFAQSNNLTRHVRTHTKDHTKDQENLSSVKQCWNYFARTGHLKSHSKSSYQK